PPPRSPPLCPYTTLFRSEILQRRDPDHRAVLVDDHGEVTFRAPELLQERGEVLRLGHDVGLPQQRRELQACEAAVVDRAEQVAQDRKSTRLNSSHGSISY